MAQKRPACRIYTGISNAQQIIDTKIKLEESVIDQTTLSSPYPNIEMLI
jgi:hypothetical protein